MRKRVGQIIQDSATRAGFEFESRAFQKTKRDATLAGNSADSYRMLVQLVSSRVGSRRLEMHSHGTLTAL
jgi:hypothetical protein